MQGEVRGLGRGRWDKDCWLNTLLSFRQSLKHMGEGGSSSPPPCCSPQDSHLLLEAPPRTSKSRPLWGYMGLAQGAVNAELRLSWAHRRDQKARGTGSRWGAAGRKANREVRAPNYKPRRYSQSPRACPLPASCQTEAMTEAHPVLGRPNSQLHLRVGTCPVPLTIILFSGTVLASRPINGRGESWGEGSGSAPTTPVSMWPG